MAVTFHARHVRGSEKAFHAAYEKQEFGVRKSVYLTTRSLLLSILK
jgi:hypothetical protein